MAGYDDHDTVVPESPVVLHDLAPQPDVAAPLRGAETFDGFRRARIAAYVFAVVVLVGDQWSKAWVVEHLASPAHPMIVVGDGVTSAAAGLARLGVARAEVEAAAVRRVIWRLSQANKLDFAAPANGGPEQLIALSHAGFPTPRRIRIAAEAGSRPLGDVVAEALRVDRSTLDDHRDDLWVTDGIATDLASPIAAGQAIALLEREITVIPNFMTLVYAENPGAAWSFMRDAPVLLRTAFFSIIAGLASLGMIWAIWTGWMGSAAGTFAIGGVLGGAIGNLIDRNRFTVVVDFILNYVGEHRWPVWNIADAGISVGVAAILLEMLWSSRRGKQNDERSDATAKG
jgi:signal peptidase II